MNIQHFFSREDIGGLEDQVLLDALIAANKKKTTNMIDQVKAKFQCSSVIDTAYGSKTAHFYAVYGTDEENASYSKATPSGNLSIVIDKDVPASDFFEQGKSYYLTFDRA